MQRAIDRPRGLVRKCTCRRWCCVCHFSREQGIVRIYVIVYTRARARTYIHINRELSSVALLPTCVLGYESRASLGTASLRVVLLPPHSFRFPSRYPSVSLCFRAPRCACICAYIHIYLVHIYIYQASRSSSRSALDSAFRVAENYVPLRAEATAGTHQ